MPARKNRPIFGPAGGGGSAVTSIQPAPAPQSPATGGLAPPTFGGGPVTLPPAPGPPTFGGGPPAVPPPGAAPPPPTPGPGPTPVPTSGPPPPTPGGGPAGIQASPGFQGGPAMLPPPPQPPTLGPGPTGVPPPTASPGFQGGPASISTQPPSFQGGPASTGGPDFGGGPTSSGSPGEFGLTGGQGSQIGPTPISTSAAQLKSLQNQSGPDFGGGPQGTGGPTFGGGPASAPGGPTFGGGPASVQPPPTFGGGPTFLPPPPPAPQPGPGPTGGPPAPPPPTPGPGPAPAADFSSLFFSAENPFRGFKKPGMTDRQAAEAEVVGLTRQHQKNLAFDQANPFQEGAERFSDKARFLQNSSLGGQDFNTRSDFSGHRLQQLQDFLGANPEQASIPAPEAQPPQLGGGPQGVPPPPGFGGGPQGIGQNTTQGAGPGDGNFQGFPFNDPFEGAGGLTPPGTADFPTQGAEIQVGQDPLSQSISTGLGGLLNSRGGPLSEFANATQNQALNFSQPGASTGEFGRRTQQTAQDFASDANAARVGQGAEGAAQGFAAGGGVGEFGRGLEGSVNELIERGGAFDPSVVNNRLETAREGLDRQRTAQTSQLEAALADRGLVGSGANIEALSGLERDLGGQFAGTLRDIVTGEQSAANNRFASALQSGAGLAGQDVTSRLGGLGALGNLAGQESSRQLGGLSAGTALTGQETSAALGGLGTAAGLASQEQGNLRDAVNAGTARQGVLSDIALRSLAENNDFTQFLAQFGLERDKTIEDIKQGRANALLPLLQSFLSTSQIANQGFIGQ